MSKKFQFYFGAFVLLIIGSMIFFPNLFTSANPYATEGMRSYVDSEAVFHLEKAPFSPQWGIPLGTDELGRHVWALIVYGTRLTMFLTFFVVIARFLLAIPLGFLAGFGSLTAHGIIDKLSRFFGTIPTLLLCIILLKMDYFIGLEKSYSIMAFVGLLGFVGFGKLGLVIEERVASIIREPFITGDVAIGKNKIQIALTTVFKHLYPELIVMFFLEFARALTLLLQLGLFGVFVGNVRFIEDTPNGIPKMMDISYEPEWASMLGAARNNIRVAPWIVFFPALAFFISVLGLNALGEGIRWVLGGELKLIKKNKRFKTVLAVVLAVLLLVQGVGYYDKNMNFNLETLDLSSLQLEEAPIMIGNENASKVAGFLAESMEDRGFKPLNGNEFIHTYTIETGYYTTFAKVVLNQKAETETEAEAHESVDKLDLTADIRWIAHGDFDLQNDLLDMTQTDLYNLTELKVDTPAILLLDAAFYNEAAVIDISKNLSALDNVKGIVWKQDLTHIRDQRMSKLTLEVPVFYIDRYAFETASEPLKGTIQMAIEQAYAKTGTSGKNIYAILPGTSKTMGEEALVYGFSYNSENLESLENLLSFQMSMIDSITKSDSNRKRTLIIAFFDGTLNDEFNGMRDYAANSYYSQKDVLLYLDFTRIQGVEEGMVIFDQEQSPISRYYAYTFSVKLKEKLDKSKIETLALANTTALDRLLYFEKSFPTMIVGFNASGGEPESTVSLETLGKILTKVIKNNNY